MDYVEPPHEWGNGSGPQDPGSLVREVAGRFGRQCFVVAPPDGGPIVGVEWSGTGDGRDAVTEIQLHQDLAAGGSAVVVTASRSPAAGVDDLTTLMADVYASHIGIDGPPSERLGRAAAARAARASTGVLSLDGAALPSRVLVDDAAVVIACQLPNSTVILFLEGNPLPRPQALRSIDRSSTR